MSTKPSKLPRLGATSPGVVTGSTVEPSEAKKTAGFVARERPPAQFIVWLFELIYEWLQYLSDGAFTGASTFGSTLGVTGLITAHAGLTADVDQHITLQGDGMLKHGNRVLPIHASAWNGQSAGGVPVYGDAFTAAPAGGTVALRAPILLPNGKRITGVTVRVIDNSGGGPTTVQVTLIRVNNVTDATAVEATTLVSTGSGLAQTLNMSGMSPVDVTNSNSYALRFLSTFGTGQVSVGMAEITYIAPP